MARQHKHRLPSKYIKSRRKTAASIVYPNRADNNKAASTGYGAYSLYTGLGASGIASRTSGYGGQPQYIYGYQETECNDSLNPFLATVVLGGLAAATFIIFQYLTMNGRRRKKRGTGEGDHPGEEDSQNISGLIQDIVWAGGYNINLLLAIYPSHTMSHFKF